MAAKTASLSVNIIADAAKAKAGLREAETAFGKFRNSVGEADGAINKFKIGSGAALDYVKANAMNFAAAAGAAIVAFGFKSVNAFQDLALGVKKFSDATGLSYEEASRLIEVAGDIGIEMGAVEKSLGFMNKTLGNNAQAFKNLGVEIAYTSGGAVDANKTFLNVVDRLNQIQDPAQRAAAGAKLLGRGWQEMAELIAMGSDELNKSLESVSKQKVMTPEQVRNAEKFRSATDNLKDSFEDFTLEIGGKLVPALTDAFEGLSSFLEKAKELSQIDVPGPASLGDWLAFAVRAPVDLVGAAKALIETSDAADGVNVATDDMARKWEEGARAMINAHTPTDDLTTYLEEQQTALDQVKGALDRLKGALNLELAMLDAKAEIDAFNEKWATAMAEGKVNAEEFQADLLRVKLMLINVADQVVLAKNTFLANQFRIMVDTGQLERALQLLNLLKSGGELKIPSGPGSGDKALMSPIKRAAGGVITKPEFAMIGEAGAEAVIPLTNPTRAMELMQASGLDMLAMTRMGGGGTTVINVNVDAGLVSSPDQVGQQIIEAIRRAERRSGQVFAAA